MMFAWTKKLEPSPAFEERLPRHDGGLILYHNEHKANYQTVAEWDSDAIARGHPIAWVSEEQRWRAIKTGSVWFLQWYPDTPVGFYARAAADLDALLDAAAQVGTP